MRLFTAAVLASVLSCSAFGQVIVSPYTIQTFAGGGPQNVPGTSASLQAPSSVAIDSAGNLFFTNGNNVVLRLDATTGVLTIVAGNAIQGYSGDSGPATSAGLAGPQGVAVDAAGNLYIADCQATRGLFTGYCRIRMVSNGFITTVAGNVNSGFSGDNGPAISAQLGPYSGGPYGIAVDSAGNLYIADTSNNRVRKVSNGVITTVAGGGSVLGDNGPATGAQLNGPTGVAADSAGNLYIADLGNNRIRKVSNGVITTVAGNGTPSYSGDDGPATSAQLNGPSGVAVDSAGNVYIVDEGNSRIRKVSNGVITTVAGGGSVLGDNGPATSAQLNGPSSVSADSIGDLYIADTGDNRIRKVSNGAITTVAGNGNPLGDNGTATSAELSNPSGVAVDSAGELYIADLGNNRIRKVSNGVITTVAGNGTAGYSGDNGPATGAQLYGPSGVALDSAGNLYIADTSNNRIRKISNGVITTVAGGGSVLGDNGPATSAQLNGPTGVAVDSAGNLYIADTVSSRVREVSNGVITTVATDWLANPLGVAVDSAGDLFIADTGNERILKISNGATTIVAGNGTWGYSGDNGPATSAQLNRPSGIAVDSAGNLFIGDYENQRIRKVSNGVIATAAGNGTPGYSGDNGPGASAELAFPQGVAVDSAGNVYIADTSNERTRVLIPSGSSCSASVAPLVLSVPGSGGNFTVAIQTGLACAWAVQGLPNWITLSGSGVGTGPGNVTLSVAANSGVARAAAVSIAGTSVQVNQASAPCNYALSAAEQAFPAAGGAGSVSVTAASWCSWTSSSVVSWATFLSGASSGTGNGWVTYQVAANTGAARSGSLTVAGLPFTVDQSGTVVGLVSAGSMAQVASGGLWNTTMTLVNTGAAAAQVWLNFFADDGSALLLPLTFPQTSSTTPLLASTLNETITAGAELVIQTAGTATQATQEGWVQLLANGSIGGSAVFGFSTAAGEQEAVAPVETLNPSAFVLSFDNTGGTGTGVALANVTNQAVSVPVVLRDGTGASLASVAAISLPAYAHTSFMLATNYPATAGILGTLELDTPAGAQISALGIRATPSGAITSIPVIAK